MVIDFHTHIFPDAIAKRTIEKLEEISGTRADTDGTKAGLISKMEKDGIDLSVILPVVTKPSQFETVNAFAKELCREKRLRSFGGIHPECENIPEKIKHIKSLGLRGVKIHPDYQGAFIEDERYAVILSECIKNDLYVVTHSGKDPLSPDCVHCTPVGILSLLAKAGAENAKPHLILAHIGANFMWEETQRLLVGKPVYFDLSCSLRKIDKDLLLKIIKTHGADKILFASDSPWSDPKKDLDYFNALPLESEEKEMILYKNALKILGE